MTIIMLTTTISHNVQRISKRRINSINNSRIKNNRMTRLSHCLATEPIAFYK